MNKTKLASFLILEKDQKILLIRRFNTGFADGMYTLPSGKVDPDESFTEAMIREGKEEVNVIIKNENIENVHMLHRKNKDENSYWVDSFFLCKNWQGEVQNMEPHKCDDIGWYSIDELPENTILFVKQVIEKVYAGKEKYSEFGW